MASDPRNFHLKVTAGPSYDTSTHSTVHINTGRPLDISSEHIDASLSVRIQNYRGLPQASPETCAYFDKAPHKGDLYSISFKFKPKQDIPGTELVFGNDFEKPIQDRLPPGFGAALKFVKWAIDPGLDGDVHADKPYLYGPLLSSINVLSIGDKSEEKVTGGKEGEDEALVEGATGSGSQVRADVGMPDASAQRMKFFLDESHRRKFTFEAGREYGCDFFNGYLDFNELALKLPVATLYLMRFWDGQPLRYTLKRRSKDGSVDQELLVVVLALIPKEEAEQEAAEHEAAGKGEPDSSKAADSKEQHGYEDEGVD